jgi:hypothetical protein
MGYSRSLGDGEKIKQIHLQKALPKSNLEGLFGGPASPIIFGEVEG